MQAERTIADAGFSVHPAVLSEADTLSVSSYLDSVHGRSRAGVRNLMRDPVVNCLAKDPRLVALAADAVGFSARPFRATLFDKSPTANWLVAWHQDTVVPLRSQRELPGWGPWSVKAGVLYAHAPAAVLQDIVALRLHLDDAGPTNGPLRVLPGSQARGVLTDSELRTLVSEVEPYECTCPRGGIIMMKPLLVHASSKASSPDRRRVVHIEYARETQLECGLELDVA